MVERKLSTINIDKNVFWNSYHIKKEDRERLHKHRSILLWFTGLSGSGKSVLANFLEKELHSRLISTYILDGDNIRHGLCKDLEFSMHDRNENIRRVGEVAKLMIDAGLVVLAAFISPYLSERKMLRNMFPINCFFEIFVDTPLYVCEKRDPKGLYKQVRSGAITNFTGINTVYEKPENPDLYINGQQAVSHSINQLLEMFIGKIFD